jgi:DNA-binding MarR family transcriptional regulator
MSAATTDLAPQEIVAVADTFVRLMRSFSKARAWMLAAAEHDVEWSCRILLKSLATEGPMRAGALAEVVQSDPSTVSRQVAGLVKDGLLERRADPADGRASILVLTEKADAVLVDHDRIRLDFFARLLDGWSAADVHRFAKLLDRFTLSHEATSATWITERIAARSAQARSTV